MKTTEYINPRTHITKCKDGYWLYDDYRGMNLAMRAETDRQALVQALEYYQERLLVVEAAHNTMDKQVNTIIEMLTGED